MIADLFQEFHQLKKLREAQESSAFDLLKSSVDSIKKSLEEEKSTREEVQQKILGLLENACEKISD